MRSLGLMRRFAFAILVAGSVAVTFTLSGCPAAHDDYPGASCKVDSDCFKGEKCLNSICIVPGPPADMSIVLPPSDLAGADMTGQPPQDAATGDDL
jgi:hypothetical protein